MARKSEGGLAELDLPEDVSGKEEQGEKRLNLILSYEVYTDLANLAKVRRTTMTEIVRLALGLIKVAIFEARKGNKLVVTTADGDVVKELILPG